VNHLDKYLQMLVIVKFRSFVAGDHTYLSLNSLTLIKRCADFLAQGRVEPIPESQNICSDNQSLDKWWSLLLGLSTIVADNRLQVRNAALDALISILKTYGHMFSAQTFEIVFKGVLLPIIDSAKTDFTKQAQSAWPTENP